MNKSKHPFLIGCIVLVLLGLSQGAIAGSKYTQLGSILRIGDANFTGLEQIALDTSGNILVAANGGNATSYVYQFNSAGVYSNTFDAIGSAGGQFSYPYGLAISADGGTVYVSEVTDPGTNAARIRSFGYDGTTMGEIGIRDMGNGGAGAIALGNYNEIQYVYMGTSAVPNFWQLPADLSASFPMGTLNATGLAVDEDGLVNAVGQALGMGNPPTQPILRFSQDRVPQSSLPTEVIAPYGIAFASSGHFVVTENTIPGHMLGRPAAQTVQVFNANGTYAFTIIGTPVPTGLAVGGVVVVGYPTIDPVTGRLYVSSSNVIYRFDVPCFLPPDTKLDDLPNPPPPSVSDAISSMIEQDINYQSAFGNLDTPSLQTAANNYEDPNITPSKTAAINSNISVMNVVQNHTDLISLSHMNGPQSFQMADHQYLADFKHRGLAAHMQKKQRGRKQQPLSGQPAQYGSGLEATPTLELMNDQKNFSVWMQNAFNQTDNAITPTVDANRSRMHAWTFGADAMVAKQSRMGVFGGSSKSHVHLMSTPLTQDNTKKKYLGLYGVHFFDIKKENITPTLDANLMLGKGHMDHTRDLSIPGFSQFATSRQVFWYRDAIA